MTLVINNLIGGQAALEKDLQFAVGHGGADGLLQIAHGFPMKFIVVGRDCVRREDDGNIPLICINGSHANTGLGIDAADDELSAAQLFEECIQLSAEEGAVALFNDFIIIVPLLQLPEDRSPLCP